MDWFGKRRESVVMKGIRDHAQKIADTMSELNRAAMALCKEDKESALDAIKRADTVGEGGGQPGGDDHRGAVQGRSGGQGARGPDASHPPHGLRRRLGQGGGDEPAADHRGQGQRIPVTLWNKYCDMTTELEKAAKQLQQQHRQPGDRHRRGDQVRAGRWSCQEHILDEMYFSTKKEILFAEHRPQAIFLMRDLLHGIENSRTSARTPPTSSTSW